ncbi:zinc-dependent metalloprotease [Brevibacterium otitidis]|uniref:Zinc-dependent metalloprotease n=1 Tax=Brevibacterium otitidis TaxID=53364 RepID=A0ABV5X680_9MICO|nr:zinc-dependent metalloprotease [Brevibacterium otitidis]
MSDENDREQQPDDQSPFGNMFGMFFGPGGGAGFGGPGDGSGQQGMPSGFPFDPAMLGGIMQQLQEMMSGAGAQKAAVQAAEQSVPTPDPAASEETLATIRDAFRIAELWLGQVTDQPTSLGDAQALTRREWVQQSLQGWERFLSPVQTNMTQALTGTIAEQAPEELKPMLAGASQMFGSMAGSMFGVQLGEALGGLSGEVLTSTDIGLPLVSGDRPVLVNANVVGAAAELDVDPKELRIYLAVRELAHLWLFKRAPWLAGHVETALAKYASGIEVDMDRIEGLAAQIDPSNLEQVSQEVREGLFNPQQTPQQAQALEQVQNLLSVIAGWADVVTYAACEALTGRDAIREALHRRLATQSSADRRFAELVGLELVPTRLRDAVALFGYLEQSQGAEARDHVFTHPDLLPTTKDLDDPLGYRERRQEAWSSESAIDEALEKILSEGAGSDAGGSGDADSGAREADSGAGEASASGNDTDSDTDSDSGSGDESDSGDAR